MKAIEYQPFSGPLELSYLMADLFGMYWSDSPALFTVNWLQMTPDLNVVCEGATEKEDEFPVPPGLKRAMQNSAGVEISRY
jgi:hypothetical protein